MEKLQKIDKRLWFIIVIFIILIALLITNGKQTKKNNVESFSFDKTEEQTDIASVINKLKEENEKTKKELEQKIINSQQNLSNQINTIKKENIYNVETVDGEKYVTTKDGSVYLVDDNNNIIKELNNNIEDAENKLGNIVDEVTLPNGEKLVTNANGEKYLIKSDGSVVKLKDYIADKNGNYIYQNENGKYIKVDKNGKSSLLKFGKDGILYDSEGNVVNSNILNGNKFKNLKQITDNNIKSVIDSNGNKYLVKPDGIYKIDENGNEVKVGKNLILDSNGNIILDGKNIGKSVGVTYKENGTFDENGNLIYSDKLVEDANGNKFINKVFEDKNGKYIVDANGNKKYVKDAFIDENGNLNYTDLNGDTFSTKKTDEDYLIKVDKDGNAVVLGKGTVVTDINGNSKINVVEAFNKNLGYELYSFLDNDNNFYEVHNNKIFKNNTFFIDGHLIFKDNIISLLDNNDREITNFTDIKEFFIKTLEFRTKKAYYKFLKDGTLIKISNNKIDTFTNVKLEIENGYLIIHNKGKITKEKLINELFYQGYITKDKNLLISQNNNLIKLNINNILNVSTYFKEKTKSVIENGHLQLHNFIDISNYRYLFDLKNMKENEVGFDDKSFYIDGIKITDGIFIHSMKNDNFKFTNLYLSNDNYYYFNINNYTYAVNLNNKTITKIEGNLKNIDNKFFLDVSNNRDHDLGKFIKSIKLLAVKDKGSIFRYREKHYLVNKYGIKYLGQGGIHIDQNGNIIFKDYDGKNKIIGKHVNTILNNKIFDKNGESINNEIYLKNIKLKKKRIVNFGESILLENNNRYFYNENMEVIEIKNMSEVNKLGYAQLVIIKNSQNQDVLFLLKDNTFHLLGKVSKINFKDNTIYKTDNGIYYILNNNVNKISNGKLENLKLIPFVQNKVLYGKKTENSKKIKLGNIITILYGEFEENEEPLANKKTNKNNFDVNNLIVKEKQNGELVTIDKDGKVVKTKISTDKDGNLLINGQKYTGDVIKYKQFTWKDTNKGNNKKEIKTLNSKELFDLFEDNNKKINETKVKEKPVKIAKPLKKMKKTVKSSRLKLVVLSSEESLNKNNIIFNEHKKTNNKNNQFENNYDNFYGSSNKILPIGTKLNVTLEGGAIAAMPLGKGGDTSLFADNYSIFRVNKDVTLSDGTTIALKGAKISAVPVATSMKRMVFMLKEIEYFDEDEEKWYLSKIKGQVIYDVDKIPGIPGIVIDEKDKYLAKSTIISMLEGTTQFITATKSPLNSAQMLSGTKNLNDNVGENLIGGASKAFSGIQDALTQMIEAQIPILVVKNNEAAEIKIIKSIKLTKR